MKGMINILGKSEIIEILDFMKLLYPNSKSIAKTDAVIDAFEMMLGSYSKKEIKQAISSLAQKSRYVPDLREIFHELKNQFKVEIFRKKDVSVIFVRYEDELCQFKCTNKKQFEEVVGFLRSAPEREDIRSMSEELMKNQFPYYAGETTYNAETQARMEDDFRKAWMNVKISEYKKNRKGKR